MTTAQHRAPRASKFQYQAERRTFLNKQRWLRQNIFHHSSFSNLGELIRLKEKQRESISLILPVLNEEATIGRIVSVLRAELMTKDPLLDELIVIDSGSEDRTREIAASQGAKVYLAEQILPDEGVFQGKGENLWKGLFVSQGDIIACIDGDIRNIHPKFVYAIIGPLLTRKDIGFVKAFYERPLVNGDRMSPLEGGRVTQILIKPLLNVFFPELSSIIQPLSGEYAGRRSVFEGIPFSAGYGVEIGLLIDIFQHHGLSSIAQVDLDCRIHRNRDLEALERMSYSILQTFFERAERYGKLEMRSTAPKRYWQTIKKGGELVFKEFEIKKKSRPSLLTVDAYQKKKQRAVRQASSINPVPEISRSVSESGR